MWSRTVVLRSAARKSRVAVVGSGNWGSAACKMVAANALRLPSVEDEVRMWVYEEKLDSGENLTDVINRTKVNVKYLPDIALGPNVVAEPDLCTAVAGATHLVLVTPHQFVERACATMAGHVSPQATAISLIKGIEVTEEGPRLLSDMVKGKLGVDCGVLMGANIASEVAKERFSEATIAFGGGAESKEAREWVDLFDHPYFVCTAIGDVAGVELCGTLKNVVAVGAGIVDGLELGNNTKSAIMRVGLVEMLRFAQLVAPGVRSETFFESCGVADLVTSCLGGRNRKVGEAFARAGGRRSFDELEAELLGGQKLQGVLTAAEVARVVELRSSPAAFPLLTTVHRIATGQLAPDRITHFADVAKAA